MSNQKNPWPYSHHKDIEEFNRIYPDVHKLEKLANKHGIYDIFQDNNGKLLQVVLLLNLKILGGREGNDAVGPDGTEYELKTLNLNNPNKSFTTHHHLNKEILKKYRTVPWVFATFQGIDIEKIYLLSPEDLETYFKRWEEKIDLKIAEGNTSYAINNPKIAFGHVKKKGQIIFEKADESPLFTPSEVKEAQENLAEQTENLME